MVKILIFAAALILVKIADAKCSRPVTVPASPLGKMLAINSVTNEVSGIYPQLLREQGLKAGCKFEFPAMPRARAEYQMSLGDADLLVGSVRVPERDAWGGEFVPMFRTQWTLISVGVKDPPTSIDELVARPGLALYVVRGFNYGPKYMSMLEKLEKKKKVEYMKEPDTIVRMMEKGRVAYTFLPSTTFVGAMEDAGVKKNLGPKVRYTIVKELSSSINGMYLSKKMSPQDRAAVKALLIQIRNDKSIFTLLRKEFTEKEMSSSMPLLKEDL
jgi:polar amino acid transport system substrate-binding protein